MPEAPSVRIVVPGAGQTFLLAGDLVTVKATAADTGGAYALFERRVPPGGGLPPHLHRYEDEAAVVLAGTLAVELEHRTVRVEAGGYVFVPRATPHAFANPGPEPARLLLLVSPGGLREMLVAELGEPVGGSTPADDTEDRRPPLPNAAPARRTDVGWIAAAEKYGTEFLAPPEREPRERSERSTTT